MSNANITYAQLLEEARQLLVHCAVLTLQEHTEQGTPAGATSVNEIHGMASRVIAEEALKIQVIADAAETER